MKLKENWMLPHTSTNLAFLDGLLCGITLSTMGWMFWNEYLEAKAFDARVAEAQAEKRRLTVVN